jgi:hypothetical protein
MEENKVDQEKVNAIVILKITVRAAMFMQCVDLNQNLFY